MTQRSDVAVLGLGNWGTALANHLARKGLSVTGWSIQDSIVTGINARHINPTALSSVQLSPNLTATKDLDEALDSPVLLVVLPSGAISSIAPQLKLAENTLLVSAIKGLEHASALTPLQYFAQFFPERANHFAVLSGPSFASDIVAGKPAGVVSASVSEETARRVAELFSHENLKVYVSTDPLGVELGGILKNVIALAAGICDGLRLGDSARAGLITRGLAEMMRLSKALGAEAQTLAGLSGLGDLIMTATCDTSRNRTVGLRLGRGEPLEAILDSLGSVAEGVSSAPIVVALAKRSGVEMPITEAIALLLTKGGEPSELVATLVSRPMKREFSKDIFR